MQKRLSLELVQPALVSSALCFCSQARQLAPLPSNWPQSLTAAMAQGLACERSSESSAAICFGAAVVMKMVFVVREYVGWPPLTAFSSSGGTCSGALHVLPADDERARYV